MLPHTAVATPCASCVCATWQLSGWLKSCKNGLDNGLKSLTCRKRLKEIYDSSLIVLYRLLFILYAEARGLLPVRESEQYRDSYSLQAMKETVAHDLDAGKLLLPTSARLWPTLIDLFGIIDAGSPPLKVATFNGGLFDPARHLFLARHTVGDAHLQRAIDKLARVKGQFVDYRDLAEQHLGTIYEGLLEYQLRPDDCEDSWTVALLNDKGERHATGSYYTPDYIVKYMVDATLGPVLRASVEGARSDAEKVARVLAVDVLDPAMGSGHFLVEATAYIARFLVELGVQESEGGDEADVAYWRRRVAQSCIYGVDLNPLAVDLAKLSLWLNTVAKDRPLSFLDHHLRAGNALVGSRIADLRRGSTSATTPKKANKRAERAMTAGQLTLFSDDLFRQRMSTAVDSMFLIEDSPARTIADVKAQEQAYGSLRRELIGKYGALANLALAAEFGLTVEPLLWPSLTDFASGRSVIVPARIHTQFERIMDEARRIAREHGLFHWELEFPEVFFDRHGEAKGDGAGFDAVIGNPPYVRQEALAPFKPHFQRAYPETYDGVADLYVYFYQRGLQLTRPGGRMSYIVTNKWMRAGYGEKLRAYFAAQGALESIVDFGHAPIFADADVFPCILVLDKPLPRDTDDEAPARQVAVAEFPRELLGAVELGAYIRERGHLVSPERFGSRAWSLESSAVDDLLAKVRRAGAPLAEFAGVKPYRGILTGLNEAFLIDTVTKERLAGQDPRVAEIIKPYLRGQDIKRWVPAWQGLWMILLKSSGDYTWPWSGMPAAEAEQCFTRTYPSLYNHLKPLEDKLRKRQDQGQYWWELRSCSYYATLETPKLVHTDITWQPQFAFVDTPLYLLNTAYAWPTVDLYILAVVNSPLLWSYMWREAMHGKDEALRLIYSFVETLPIAPPSDDIRAEVEPAVARLVAITRDNMEARGVMLDWLHTEFGVDAPGQRLEDFARLDADAFVEEARKRRPKAAGALTPATLKALKSGYAEQTTPLRRRHAEAAVLERALSDLVNAAYGLTPAEIDLLWATAPPRMPIERPTGAPPSP